MPLQSLLFVSCCHVVIQCFFLQMKLFLLLLLPAVLALSSASLQDIVKKSSQRRKGKR